jgi:AMMECR1 domain-containing protein
VATQYGWDRTTFLEHTCLKSGLNPAAWQDPQTLLYTFEAEVFSESQLSSTAK